MIPTTLIGFCNNAALLIALVLIYDVSNINKLEANSVLKQMLLGIILGAIGAVIMTNPWEFYPGIIFDTRSILLCISGFFFGTIPTLIAMLVCSGYRVIIGGAGVLTGIAVIITSGVIGLAWRCWRKNDLTTVSTGNLYALGMGTHVAMLLWMLTLPDSAGLAVLSKISLPVLVIFPVATVLIGKFIINRFQRINSTIALKENEQKYRNLLESLQEGVWSLDHNNLTTFANLPLANMLGYAVDEMIGKSLFSFMDEQGADVAKQTVQLSQNASAEQHELQLLRKDGTNVDVLMVVRPTHDDTGKYSGAIAGVIDITKHKQAEKVLRQSEEELRAVLDATPFPVAFVELQSDKILYWSKSASELFGHTAQTSAKWYEMAFPDPEYRREAITRWKSFLEIARSVKQSVNAGEYRITCEDSSERICEIYATYLPSKLVVTFNDISQRRRTEERLKEKSDFLDKIIESAALSTWISDEEGTAIRANPACLEFFGATEDEVIGKYNLFEDAVLKRNGLIPTIEEVFEKAKPANIVMTYDFGAVENVTVKKPTHKTINSILTPIKASSGKVSNVIVQTIDLTEIKRMEKELMQSRKMESIGSLAGGIAHDFNNILAAILGFSELALDEVEKGSSVENNLQEIYAGGLRAKEIVKQILAFARRSDEELQPTRIDTIILEALKLIRPSTPASIEIRKDIDSSSLIMANTTQIHQIMMNLCTNAAQAMQDNGGVLEVSLKDIYINEESTHTPRGLKEGKYIKLVISDTGCGIAPEYIDLIFDPYFTTKDTGEGTGMGLAMVRGIIDSYGGTITVESTHHIKTVFSIYLPVTGDLEKQTNSGIEELPEGKQSILFVDDEPSIARMGSRILESLGYSVTFRTSSLDALELFKTEPERFALVITDMTMPQMTGDKLAIAMKQIRKDIQIILCTGYSNKITAEIAHNIGIDAFIDKPFSKTDLAKTVKKALDKESL